ncbi:unnamed protein product, partial [Prorocentrum cordatum]
RMDPNSPMNHMKREFVNSLLKYIAERDHFATREDYCPLIKPDIRRKYQPMMHRILKTLTGNAPLTIEEAGSGKTPFMRILAMTTARHNADVADERHPGRVKAAVRASAELDYFRGEVGEPWAPCVFDDGGLADQRPRALKAVFGPAQAEAMTRARRRATKFARGQARRLAKSKRRSQPGFLGSAARLGRGNECNSSAEPSGEEWGFAATSPDAAQRTAAILSGMFRPAFPMGMSERDFGAMLERCVVAQKTKRPFFFRPAGKGSVVEKLPLASSYIAADAGKISTRPLNHKKRRDQGEHDRPLAFEKEETFKLMAEAGQSGDVGAAPEGDDLVGRRGGADAGADVAEEEGAFDFGGGMGATESAPPKWPTAARNVRVDQLIERPAATPSSPVAARPSSLMFHIPSPLALGLHGVLRDPQGDPKSDAFELFQRRFKREKARMAMRPAPMKKAKKGPLVRKPKNAPYTRHGSASARLRLDRAVWSRCLKDSVNIATKQVIDKLKKGERLADQAAALFCAVAQRSQVAEGIYSALRAARAKHANAREKRIVFGQDKGGSELERAGAEADENPIIWEQRGCVVQRRNPGPLALFRPKPEKEKAKRRAPGPGPTRKRDRAPKAPRWLKHRRAILHADGARPRWLKIDGALRDWAAHKKKKRARLGGKWARAKPAFTKVRHRNVPDQKKPRGAKRSTARG